LIEINQNERIPADMIVIKSAELSGSIFIRTDQLDGETDWKLRKSIPFFKNYEFEQLANSNGYLIVDLPSKNIYEFIGN
jgi:phospholipid-translocating ATPase